MREKILAPSIFSADFMNLGRDIDETVKAGSKYIHFDVMDGQFVPNISFGIPVLKSVRKGTDAFLDVHLMIIDPENYVEEFVKAGADMVTFHYEATEKIEETIKLIHDAGAKAGLVIKPKTSAEAVFPYLGKVEMVLIMSVEPGFGGQKFMPESLDKVRAVRKEADQQGYDLDIEIDGGITADNITMAVEAGVNVAVAGSAVFKGDITANTKALIANLK